eukprot:347386-Pelagomonas_calceolata.AAC.2
MPCSKRWPQPYLAAPHRTIPSPPQSDFLFDDYASLCVRLSAGLLRSCGIAKMLPTTVKKVSCWRPPLDLKLEHLGSLHLRQYVFVLGGH